MIDDIAQATLAGTQRRMDMPTNEFSMRQRSIMLLYHDISSTPSYYERQRFLKVFLFFISRQPNTRFSWLRFFATSYSITHLRRNQSPFKMRSAHDVTA